MKPLRIAFPLGIGDVHWVCTKLKGLSAHHDGRSIHAYVNESVNHASIGYLEIAPQIAKAFESEEAIYLMHEDLPEHYKSDRWSTLEGSAGWRGFDYVLIANGHLESGKPLSTWLPELPTEYCYRLKISRADRAYARSLALPGSVLLYPSGISANRGFHRDTWTVRHWADVIRLLNDDGIVPVLVGAKSHDDRVYRDRVAKASRKLEFVDTVAKTSIPQVLAMIEDAACWCGLNSGLGIVSAMRKTPTLMLWADSRYPLRGAATYTMHPAMQRSWLNKEQLKTYRTLSYGSRALSPQAVVREILGLIRLRLRRAA